MLNYKNFPNINYPIKYHLKDTYMSASKKYSLQVNGNNLNLAMILFFTATELPQVLIKTICNNADIGSVTFIVGWEKYLREIGQFNHDDHIYDSCFALYNKRQCAERLLENKDSKTHLTDEQFDFLEENPV